MSKAVKNNLKKELKKMSVQELQQKLQQLESERMKLTTKMFKGTGTSVLTRNYPTEKQATPFGNLRDKNKNIARVKTFLNIKLMSGERR